MKVIRIYNQHRRDCHCDLECESCGNKETITSAYDDDNYWVNVIPNKKCSKCNKSTKELGLSSDKIQTKYPEHFIV